MGVAVAHRWSANPHARYRDRWFRSRATPRKGCTREAGQHLATVRRRCAVQQLRGAPREVVAAARAFTAKPNPASIGVWSGPMSEPHARYPFSSAATLGLLGNRRSSHRTPTGCHQRVHRRWFHTRPKSDCSSHPSSPTYVTRNARTGHPAMPMICCVPNGKDSFDSSARVTAPRMSRDRGPISDSTALADGMSISRWRRPESNAESSRSHEWRSPCP